jgi:opacity protein-like surface antigen
MNASLSIKTIALVSLLAGLPAAAQNLASADAWQFEFIPYLWLSGIRSDIKLGPLPGSTVHIKSSSVLDALDFGAMGTLEARKGPWGGLLDMQYVKLSVSNQFLGGLASGYNFKYDQTLITMAGYYRFVDSPAVQVEVLGGARYIDAHGNLDIPPSLLGLGRRFDNSAAWWNGIIGVRAFMPINDKWTLMGYLDGGEGNSTSSWQAILGTSYQYSPTTSFKFGYRYLAVKLDEAALSKVALGGFYAGIGFKF